MRSRLSLYLNSLSLEEILYLSDEIERRKDKYRQFYAVLSVQADHRVLKAGQSSSTAKLVRELKKYISGCAAQGGGIQLAHSPEVSVLLFTSVEGASRTCTALVTGLPEMNAKWSDGSFKIGFKLGLACGEDTLSPGSQRCVRTSPLVKRANQAAWRAASGTLMMDDCAYEGWPERQAAARFPIDIDGHSIYRAVPGGTGSKDAYDNDKLNSFLAKITSASITTLKYTLEREDNFVAENKGSWSAATAIAILQLEGYDLRQNKNHTYTERLSASGYTDRLESIRKLLSEMGLSLVKLESVASPRRQM